MSIEYLDIFDEFNQSLYTSKSRADVHAQGDWHRTVHVWFYTVDQILLQLRSKMKSVHPELWDISVAGHVLAGTDPIDGALREISEEVGLTVAASDLKFSHIHKGDYGMNKEFVYIYFYRFTHDVSKLILQKEEVEAMKLITPAHLRHELHTFPDRYVPHGDYWTEMITLIEVAQKKLQTSA